MRKFIAVILLFTVLITSVTVPAKKAEANPLVLAWGVFEVSGEMVTALLTLIAAGLTIHTSDMGIAAAKAYKDSHTVSAPVNNTVNLTSTQVSDAKSWLDSYTGTVTQTTTEYIQAIGNTLPARSSFSAILPDSVNLVSGVSFTSPGVSTMEIQGWQGIKDWVTSSSGGAPYIWVSALGQTVVQMDIHGSYLELENLNGPYAFVTWDINTISALRLFFNLAESISNPGTYVLDVGVQVIDTSGTGTWVFPSDAPVVSNVDPTSISVDIAAQADYPVSIDWDMPITYGPADMTYNPAAPKDWSVPVPTDWPINKTIDDLATPQVQDPTDVLGWLKQIWTWIQEFWAWLKALGVAITAALDITAPLDLSPMQKVSFDLTNRFPFSLPWDMSRALTALNTPGSFDVIETGFYNPITKEMIPVTFDLSFMEPLVPIVRSGFLLLFTIGLVMATRKLLGGAQ